MSKWRPADSIRVKALGLHWRNGKLLAAEVYGDTGILKGVRPLGGSVEFGETARETVVREFKEELGIDIIVGGTPFFFENIYVHERAPGHELLVLFNIDFPENALVGQSRIEFFEDSGAPAVAGWFDLDELDLPGGPALYPSGLKEHLRGQAT